MKYFAVLNKKHPIPTQLNALAHMALGLGNVLEADKHSFADYFDRGGERYPNISEHPFIILQAKNANQIRTLRSSLEALDQKYTSFLDTMTIGSHEEQLAATKEKNDEDLEYIGLCGYSDREEINQLLKKLSLHKGL